MPHHVWCFLYVLNIVAKHILHASEEAKSSDPSTTADLDGLIADLAASLGVSDLEDLESTEGKVNDEDDGMEEWVNDREDLSETEKEALCSELSPSRLS